jgi:hypothetical protein
MSQHSSDSLDSQDRTEIWKPIPNYEDTYEASTLGRIRSLIKRSRYPAGMFKKASLHKKTGYYYMALTNSRGVERKHYIHCLVMDTFNPIDDKSLEVNHVDGDKSCNALSNLEWLTHRANMLHYVNILKPAREKPDTRTNVEKLTDNEVTFIHGLVKSGNYEHEKISRMFCISIADVIDVLNRPILAKAE